MKRERRIRGRCSTAAAVEHNGFYTLITVAMSPDEFYVMTGVRNVKRDNAKARVYLTDAGLDRLIGALVEIRRARRRGLTPPPR